jgi:hypothetical protein
MEYRKASKEEAKKAVEETEATLKVIRTWMPQKPQLELTPEEAEQVLNLAYNAWGRISSDMKVIRTFPDGTTGEYLAYPVLAETCLAELQFLGSVSINYPDAHLYKKVDELFPDIYLHVGADGSTPANLEEARRCVLDQAEYTLECAKRSLAKLE